MNNRFKFRVWHSEDKKMYLLRSISTGNQNTEYSISGYTVQDEIDFLQCFNTAHEFNCCTLMQCIGRKDKNNNLIFEGDIIEYIDPEGDNETIIDVVYWGGDYPAFDLQNHEVECNAFAYLSNNGWHIEVVGNIYENPELLENNNDRQI